jgi:signal transduction histidine kinase
MQRLWIVSITGALISAIILAIVLYRNFKNKKKANVLLKEQKEEIEATLEKLESTQTQLIQSEKMASLGELTAGIAHEIQNPLNFVNNFSEVNSELIEELEARSSKLKAYLPDGQAIEDLIEVDELLKDIRDNEQKIKHHGQRADSIVKGMLQHSRSSNGQKVLTDINALADEYLRLAYHGLRAKDKSFNADFSTDLDENLRKVNVVPQDIGRVLLNLINNAFHAVSERSKKEDENYKPLVTITTGIHSPLEGGKGGVSISVKDNGPGISEDIKDKIFQPFFTTKATGQGTGLGLSLSYDIIKAHGGELKVDSKEGVGSVFIIYLPIIND